MRLRAILAESPVLPLSVEFVAGGEGSPEPMGLGGSGRSGMVGGTVLTLLLARVDGVLPMYMAESGRSLDFIVVRGGMDRLQQAWTDQKEKFARCGRRGGGWIQKHVTCHYRDCQIRKYLLSLVLSENSVIRSQCKLVYYSNKKMLQECLSIITVSVLLEQYFLNRINTSICVML